jgi:hypothetical protein
VRSRLASILLAAAFGALQAQREIDWARYGEEFRRLGQLLEQLGTAGSQAPQ